MFKKIYFKTKLISAFIKKNLLFLIIGSLIGSLFFIILPLIKEFIDSPQFKTKKIGIVGFYTYQNLPPNITNLISFGLTQSSSSNKAIPSPLLKEWAIQNDNKEFILTINTDHFWHNGQKFNVKDIDYKISGAKIEKIAKDKIKISLEKPFSPLLSILNQPLFKNKKKLIGLGPYKVEKISYRQNHIKKIFLQNTEKKREKNEFTFYDNEKDLISAFKLGEINQIDSISSPKELDKWPKVKISPHSESNQNYIALFFNTQKVETKTLRQAFAYATKKNNDKKNRCISPISPNSWAYNDSVKVYNYNPNRAKELFKNNQIEKINITLNNRKLLPLAEKIKKTWQSILNIKTSISVENQINTNDFDIILAYGSIPQDPDQYSFWHSTQQSNITKLNNPKIDKLLEEGRQSFDIQERKQIYLKFQKSLLEECPAIFLHYPTTYSISKIN